MRNNKLQITKGYMTKQKKNKDVDRWICEKVGMNDCKRE